ncbi:MAG: pilus assembly protein TadG-related protein, partial [Gaiellaceae bacterium]
MLRLLQRRRDERGSILVFVGIGLPVLLAALSLVLDVGDWFVQKRSLQNQVDAATLAGSDRWGACFSVGGQDIGPSGVSAGAVAMQLEATAYGGGTYNPQIGGDLKGQLQPLAFNQTTYPFAAPPSATADDTTPDPCYSYDASNAKCDMSSPAAGCRIQFDVKATENKLPLLLGGLLPSAVRPNLHATARSELREVAALQPSMPLAVPDVHPQLVTITFVNTSTGNIVAGPCTGPNLLAGGGCTFKNDPPPTPNPVATA